MPEHPPLDHAPSAPATANAGGLEAGSRLGRWSLIAPLGKGGMATVWRARRDDGLTGAVKVLNADGGTEAARRLVREHRALQRLQHPNIVQVHDGGVWERRPWYAMELVEGEDLRATFDRWNQGDLPPPDVRFALARRVIAGVGAALAHVHALGIVHRDVTPGNIRLVGDTVKLMDFGVVKEQDTTELTAHGELLGTVAWVAPEQILGGTVDGRADLYSLGGVLYTILTGRRPFQARTLAGYLDKHLHDTVRPPAELESTVPGDLDAACVRLLRKTPDERFDSATHLLRALEGPVRGPLRMDAEWPPTLAGRTEDLAALGAAVGACREGQGAVWVVQGAAGSGKSRLARAVRAQAERAGLRVLSVRARDTGNPLDVYARVYHALRAEGLAPSPVLERIFGPQGWSAPGAAIERYALFTAFRDLFAGSPPRLCLVDDVHLADPGSLQLLEYLVRNTIALGSEPILWVFLRAPHDGTTDADPLDGILAMAEARPHVRPLLPLRPSAVEEVVLGLVADGPEARALATRLHTDSDGVPGMLVEMVRALAEQGAFADDADGSRRLTLPLERIAEGALPMPRSLRARLVASMDARSDLARRVVEALAVATTGSGWHDAPVTVLAATCDLSLEDAQAAVDELVEASVTRTREGPFGATVEFVQPRARDLLYGELDTTARARLHRRVGEALERGFRRRMHHVVEALAAHFEQAGSDGKAYTYLVRAGERLLARSFALEAERYLTRALAIEPRARELLTLEDADRLLCETLLRRAEALDHLGRGGETLDDLMRARTLAEELDSDALQARAWTGLGMRARQAHDLVEGEACFTRAVAFADRAKARDLRVFPLSSLAGMRWSRGDLDGAERVWRDAMETGAEIHDERGAGFGANGLGLVALCRGQAAEARKHFEASAEIFERLGLLFPLATARVNLVEIHHFTGNFKRGLELADRTLAQARETGHQLGIARGHHHRALLLVDLGRFDQGRQEAARALAIVRQLGQMEDELSTLSVRLRGDWAVGDLAAIREGLAEAEPLLERYDPEGFAPILVAWGARLAAADGDRARAHALLDRARAWPGLRWPYQECRFDLVLARVYAALGDPGEATRRAEAAIRRGDASGFRLYTLKGHQVAAACSPDEAATARHRRVADALARSLAANLPREDAERFLDVTFAPDPFSACKGAT